MTIDETVKGYPHINFRYTKTHIPIEDSMPEGYRWADEVEVEYWWHIEGAIGVKVAGAPGDSDWTDIAVPINGLLDQQAYHS